MKFTGVAPVSVLAPTRDSFCLMQRFLPVAEIFLYSLLKKARAFCVHYVLAEEEGISSHFVCKFCDRRRGRKLNQQQTVVEEVDTLIH